jgi:putative addiction module component (TIGR02574 family)
MNDRIKKLAEQARHLTPDERADLIDELLTMAPEPMPGWDKAWSEEAARRWQAFGESGTDAYSWGDVKNRLRKE